MHRILSYRSLMVVAAIALAPFALQGQAAATVTCKDGTTSTATGRGACSGHGGVDKSAAKATKSQAKSAAKAAKAETKQAKADTKADVKADTKADAKATTKSAKSAEKATSKAVSSDVKETGKGAATRTAANTDPTNATAKCKDGTYSHAATHRGACSRHGGVAEWLKS